MVKISLSMAWIIKIWFIIKKQKKDYCTTEHIVHVHVSYGIGIAYISEHCELYHTYTVCVRLLTILKGGGRMRTYVLQVQYLTLYFRSKKAISVFLFEIFFPMNEGKKIFWFLFFKKDPNYHGPLFPLLLKWLITLYHFNNLYNPEGHHEQHSFQFKWVRLIFTDIRNNEVLHEWWE